MKANVGRTPRAIVLLSGGMDSATALYWTRLKGYDTVALLFDYGQRHLKELQAARALARTTGTPFESVKFVLPWQGSALTDRKIKLPYHQLKNIGRGGIPLTYVPARNTIFLSFALSWADVCEAEAVVIGANALDYSGYPDCRPKYFQSIQRVARLGTKRGTERSPLKILTPLVRLSKSEIVELGARLGVPFEKTWSCYTGGRRSCRKCDACLLRAKGFKEAGFSDPLESLQRLKQK